MYITLPTPPRLFKKLRSHRYIYSIAVISNDKRETDHVITPFITLNLKRLHIVKTYPYLVAVDRIVKYLKLF